jgi:hypothetical protein
VFLDVLTIDASWGFLAAKPRRALVFRFICESNSLEKAKKGREG